MKKVYFFDRMNEIREGHIKRYKGEKAVVISDDGGRILDPKDLYASEEAARNAKTLKHYNKIKDGKDLIKALFLMIKDMEDGADLDGYAYAAAVERANEFYKLPASIFIKE